MISPRSTELDLDPRRALAQLAESHAEARSISAADVELYRRIASTRRVELDHVSEVMHERAGLEDGLALRVVEPETGRAAFAATSGSGSARVRALALRAQRMRHEPTVLDLWHRGGSEPIADHDALVLPSVETLATWLGEATERFERTAGRRGLRLARSWVEVAATVEAWHADGGFQATRTRLRAWALAEAGGQGASSVRSIRVAGRGLARLDPGAFEQMLDERCVVRLGEAAVPLGRATVVFDPESAAVLVGALVRAVHRREELVGSPVGPGWILDHEPGESDRLLGGRFDDGGFPTRAARLADGRTVTGVLDPSGHLRRPSYRDRPIVAASCATVRAGEIPAPARCLVASCLTLHELAPGRWVLEVDAGAVEDGRMAGARRVFVPATPLDLVQRCVGAIGPPRESTAGVLSPALVFEDLPVAQ
jgi:hypothetical protein